MNIDVRNIQILYPQLTYSKNSMNLCFLLYLVFLGNIKVIQVALKATKTKCSVKKGTKN